MKSINIAEGFYKSQFKRFSAKCDWAFFKSSWAGQLWIERNRKQIIEIYEQEKQRFGWSRNYILGI